MRKVPYDQSVPEAVSSDPPAGVRRGESEDTCTTCACETLLHASPLKMFGRCLYASYYCFVVVTSFYVGYEECGSTAL